jgi:four helix bundle protein
LKIEKFKNWKIVGAYNQMCKPKINVMSRIKNFEDLKVWKDAAAIAIRIYRLCSTGQLSTDFGARDQLRRAAVSISNNIAEGFEYNNNKDFVKYLRYSKGSAGELRSNLYILAEAEIINLSDYQTLRDEIVNVSRELEGFIKYLKEFDLRKSTAKRSDYRNR